MKIIDLTVNNYGIKKSKWLSNFIKEEVKNLIFILLFISWIMGSNSQNKKHVSQYEEVIESLQTENQVLTEFDNLIEQVCKTIDWEEKEINRIIDQKKDEIDNWKIEKKQDYKISDLKDFVRKLIRNYLHKQRINIHNLRIWRDSGEKKWNIAKGLELFALNPEDFFLTGVVQKITFSIEKILKMLSNLSSNRSNNQNLLFFLEVITRVIILKTTSHIFDINQILENDRNIRGEQIINNLRDLLINIQLQFWMLGPSSIRNAIDDNLMNIGRYKFTFSIAIISELFSQLTEKITSKNQTNKETFLRSFINRLLIVLILQILIPSRGSKSSARITMLSFFVFGIISDVFKIIKFWFEYFKEKRL